MLKVSSDLRKLITGRLLPDAVAYFRKTLSVRRPVSPLRLQRDCGNETKKRVNGNFFRYCLGECKDITYCGEVGTIQIPEAHLDVCRTCDSSKQHCTNKNAENSGLVNTDFVLYVSAFATSNCHRNGDVIAYASTCQQEGMLDRPIAGFVNFCVSKMKRNLHYSHLLAIVKHEIFHAIGFSKRLYSYYRAEDGTPLTQRIADGRPASEWSEKVIKEVTRNEWRISNGSSISHKVLMIVTPRVVKEVQSHFNCSLLEGAEIENQGDPGQRHTHLEKRVFENEAMTGVFTNNPVFSRITLAVMEDTGWYRVDYAMAEPLDWGRNAGCIFARNSCKAWMDHQSKMNNSIAPYCSRLPSKSHTHSGCTHNYHGVGVCNLRKYKTPLGKEYRYFDFLPGVSTPTYYGGGIELADYCPYYQELDWKQDGITIRGSSCKHETNNPISSENYALEMYGENSACFLHGQAWMQKQCSKPTVTAVNWGSGCYSYTCSGEGLTLSISGQSYTCWFTGQILNIVVVHKNSLHNGSIICPSCDDFCDSCPMVESRNFLNSTYLNLLQYRSNNVLVCCSLSLHQSFNHIAVFLLLSMLVIERLC
ncbi:leishmanolysin-like peptidase [Dendronephthya gigantea]|uniref:leishmanolysin-like peptidase n=1 Tax=Dendronephthya gigantea TaxID=151771 RepID=UPI00106CDB08|nr:leishmanolysin-like peptidase [Dendronephthya gigantea]